MARSIRIRNVPDSLHGALKSRAALEGMSLSRFVLRHLERLVERPTRAELLARITRREPVRLPRSAAALLREERESR